MTGAVMPYAVTLRAVYPRDPDTVFAEALHFGEMKQAMAKIAIYEGLPDGEVAAGERFTVDVLMWGFLRTKNHVMYVESLDCAARVLQSREHNPSVARWDHTLSLDPHPQGALWTDHIVLEAGWQTPFVARFCRYVYSHRHRTRGALSLTREIIRQ
ncbi:hypothetical protein [uncultured Sulfitobacter sp.]|uniref:hypothetical protein n=1 Tax=uncultured Sulfitobacter sp. TaxID=191468 RepID=UPI00261BAC8F|nr:hypothetical protein [uncultured Sulfitobacter sp.]